MRTIIIAGNWKMNTTLDEAVALVKDIRGKLDEADGVVKIVCPPFISLAAVRDIIKGSPVKLGAQNVFYAAKGAYTGEISPVMLAGLCDYVIIGHSERRQYFGESDEIVNKKVRAAQAAGLKPILCVGERLEERKAGKAQEVVTRQMRGALALVSNPRGMVVAYEPVWAIGIGLAATGEDATAIIGLIRRILADLYGEELAQQTRIQYGGSVTAANVAEFLRQPEIDGALVGGASLKAADFVSIVEQAARLKG